MSGSLLYSVAAMGALLPAAAVRFRAADHRDALFWLMLAAYAKVDRNPPFTTKQLEALVTPDVFDVIDWPGIFGVRSTPLHSALEETFRHPVYSKVALTF